MTKEKINPQQYTPVGAIDTSLMSMSVDDARKKYKGGMKWKK